MSTKQENNKIHTHTHTYLPTFEVGFDLGRRLLGRGFYKVRRLADAAMVGNTFDVQNSTGGWNCFRWQSSSSREGAGRAHTRCFRGQKDRKNKEEWPR